MADFGNAPPLAIMNEAYGELKELASRVVVDADWQNNPTAVDNASLFVQSYFAICVMANMGWPAPFHTGSRQHTQWCQDIVDRTLRCRGEGISSQASVYLAYNVNQTKHFLQYMKDTIEAL